MVRFVVLIDAVIRGREGSLAVRQRVEQAAMPGLAGIEGDLEAEPAIGIHRFGLLMLRSNRYSADEIAVAIDRPQLLLPLRPFRGDPSAPHDVTGLHLEDIGEVAAQRDLELKAYPLHAVVRDVEVLVHAAADRSADDEAERARQDDAVSGVNLSIGKICA